MATARYYGGFFRSLFEKQVSASDTFKLMLCTNAYSPNQDTHRFKSDVTNEVSAPGYVAGGFSIGALTVSYDAATNTISIDGIDANWPSSTITARWAVLYDSTPSTDATRPLVGFVDFGGDMSSVAATFSVVWAGNGIAAVTVG